MNLSRRERSMIRKMFNTGHPRHNHWGPACIDRLAAKASTKARLEACAEQGMVAVIESGRDCDGVQYWGRRHLIPATVMHYYRLWNHTEQWADGPFWFDFERPSAEVEYGSRDLTLEAFEDGHPHVLYT